MNTSDPRLGLFLTSLLVAVACDPDSKSVTASDSDGTDSATSTSGASSDDDAATDPSGDDGMTSTTGDEPQPYCLETETVLTGPDEVSPLGFPAADLIALSNGWSLDFVWSTDIGSLEIVPAGTTTQLDLGLSYAGGEIRFIQSMDNPDLDIEIDPDCSDRLEIDMELQFTTADGRFGEQLEITTVASSASQLSFEHYTEPDGFTGTFSDDEVTIPEGNSMVERFALLGEFAAGEEPTGGLWIEYSAGMGEGGFLAFGLIAGWPDLGGP